MRLTSLLNTGFLAVYSRLFSKHTSRNILGKIIRDCKSVLDLGCGASSPLRFFSKERYCVGVDAFEPSIEQSKQNNIHAKYYKMDVLDIDKEFEPNSFDCVVALDLIEHLAKEEGNRLIEKMETVARKKVIIFTPNGFAYQGVHEDNYYLIHKSGWTVEEMRARGYIVIGINGWKPLRGERSFMKFRPKLVWRLISELSQFIVVNRPSMAYQILCVKVKKSVEKG